MDYSEFVDGYNLRIAKAFAVRKLFLSIVGTFLDTVGESDDTISRLAEIERLLTGAKDFLAFKQDSIVFYGFNEGGKLFTVAVDSAFMDGDWSSLEDTLHPYLKGNAMFQ
jgi:hypothetical protein